MPPEGETVAPIRSPIGLAWGVVGAWVAIAGFRVGVLPGGQVGIDILLVALGWWVAGGGPGYGPFRRRVTLGWSVLWRPVLVAIALTIVWVLVEDSTARDVLVRGQGLATLGGYANWHQLSLGPVEVMGSRLETPLQHMWALAVVTQCLLLWLVVLWATRGAAARRPDRVDPAATVGLVLALVCGAVGAALAFGGASGQALLLASPVRALPFLMGAALGAGLGSGLRDDIEAISAKAWPVAATGLVALAVLGAPDGTAGRWSAALVGPLLALLLVAGTASSSADDPDEVPVWPWSVVVAAWVLLPPCLAIARVGAGGPTVVWTVLGGVIAAVAVASVVVVEMHASTMPADIERRRTLGPPIGVALMVLLFSVTGAFGWHDTQTREEWERTNTPEQSD